MKRHHLLLPLDARNRRRRRFFFLPLSPPSNLQKDAASPLKDADLPTTFHVLDGRWRGGNTVAAPSTSPSPVFAYKNRGRGRKKETENKREERDRKTERERTWKREEKRKKRKDERKRKEKERKKRQRRKKKTQRKEKKPPATVPPPQQPPGSPPGSPPLQVSPPPFLFCLHFFLRHSRRAQCTSAGGQKLVIVLMHSNQLMWGGPSPCSWATFGLTHVFGPDPAYFKRKKSKIFVSTFYNFPRSFYDILINIRQYFTS